MRQAPKYSIDIRAINVWRINASLYLTVLWLILIILGFIFYFEDWPLTYLIIGFILLVILSYLFIHLFPKLRYRRWKYEIFEQEIYIQRGIFIMTRTLVPMIRIQHVDTEQGPITKRFHVASVSISTAATTHIIPALSEEDASNLRDRISELARVDEDDV